MLCEYVDTQIRAEVAQPYPGSLCNCCFQACYLLSKQDTLSVMDFMCRNLLDILWLPWIVSVKFWIILVQSITVCVSVSGLDLIRRV